MASRTITFNGKESDIYGVYVGAQQVFDAPTRDVTLTSIPGRNGDLLVDNGRFNNIDITYKAVCPDNFMSHADDIKAWLCAPTGYCKITDDRFPGEYRMGVLKDGIKFNTGTDNKNATFDIKFNCKPQRYIDEDEYDVEETGNFVGTSEVIDVGTSLTEMPCAPLITVTVKWSGGKLNANANNLSIDIDPSYTLDYLTNIGMTSTTTSGEADIIIDYETLSVTTNVKSGKLSLTIRALNKILINKTFFDMRFSNLWEGEEGGNYITSITAEVNGRWWKI